jgi:NTP pyrophosphatase (non-canonical NTP hydrolase)
MTVNYMDAILEELKKAELMHPDWPKDIIHAVAIMQEESGEAIRAAIQYTYEKGTQEAIEKELIQTAAMCLRCLFNLNDVTAS